MTLLDVGRVGKPHGLRGEVIVHLTTNRTERLDAGQVLVTERGPLTVEASRPHQQGWIVAFDGILSREMAEELRGLVLRAEPLDDPDALWVHELIGAVVVDRDGVERGTVVSVLANPASDLLELESGALVPLRFVVSHGGGRIVVDAPEGLFG